MRLVKHNAHMHMHMHMHMRKSGSECKPCSLCQCQCQCQCHAVRLIAIELGRGVVVDSVHARERNEINYLFCLSVVFLLATVLHGLVLEY